MTGIGIIAADVQVDLTVVAAPELEAVAFERGGAGAVDASFGDYANVAVRTRPPLATSEKINEKKISFRLYDQGKGVDLLSTTKILLEYNIS